MAKKRAHVSAKNQVREELAQKQYLDPESPGYLNELKARELAGYSKSYAKSASGSLWARVDLDSLKDILPQDSENIGEELKKWVELMAKWREKLNEVDDPVKLGSRTFAVVASYIERLAKIFGLIIDRQEKRELKANVEEKHVYHHFDTKEELVAHLEEKKMLIDADIERLKTQEGVDQERLTGV